jgi:hypothetical protein
LPKITNIRHYYQFLAVDASPDSSGAVTVGMRVFPDTGAVTVVKFAFAAVRPRVAATLTTPQMNTITDALVCFLNQQTVPTTWSSAHPAATHYALVPGQKRICSEVSRLLSSLL